MIKLVLAGTPEFSVPIFEELIKNFDVCAIISQPDRPANRGHKVEKTPVSKLAEKYDIKCYQPEKIGELKEQLEKLDFDFFISCAFGQYVPSTILKLAKKYSLNIHGSLLPKYRGAAPVQYSLLNGDEVTGISLIEMVKEMDAGDIFAQKSIKIDKLDTAVTLFKKLSNVAKENIVNWINSINAGNFERIKQDESKVILSPKLNKDDALLTKDLTCQEAVNKIRAFAQNPGAYVIQNNKRIKIYLAIAEKMKNSLELSFKDGSIYAVDYQFESKKRTTLIDYL